MDVVVSYVCGTIVLLCIAILIYCRIVEGIRRKHDLEMYINEYRKVKDEKDKLKVKVDTINRIYRNYETKILNYTNEIVEELMIRLPRISKKYLVSGLDKKYILDLIFMVGVRFSHENLQDLETNRFFELKPSKLTIREASLGLLDLIKESRLFSTVMFDKEKTEVEQSAEIYGDLKKFLEYTNRLLSE